MPLMLVSYTRGAICPERLGDLAGSLMDVVISNHVAAKMREELLEEFRIRFQAVEPAHHLMAGSPPPRPLYEVELVVPAGSLEGERKSATFMGITQALLDAEGTNMTPGEATRVWILVRDIPDGKWAVGGLAVTAQSIFETLLRRRVRRRRERSRDQQMA